MTPEPKAGGPTPRHSPAGLVADAMLGSLARKLRILGFDTVYWRQGSDQELVRSARRSGRVVLTADREVVSRAGRCGVAALLVRGATDSRRLSSLLGSASASGMTLDRGGSMCAACGRRLSPVRRADCRGLVPPEAWRRHRLFLRCDLCERFYWKGSHWKELRGLQRIVRSKTSSDERNSPCLAH